MKKRRFIAHYTFTLNVPIEAASLEVAYRRSGRLTYSDAVARMQSVNYHHWTVEDPDTGAAISSRDPETVVTPAPAQGADQANDAATKECDA